MPIVYQDLRNDEIRLLDLLPGPDSTVPQCRLRVVTLESRPRYECLSYTWGSREQQSTVLIDDSHIGVTRSVFGALATLRRPQGLRTLWIDQLCINQGDRTERAKQVRLMHKIYQGAESTAIYLHDDQTRALEFGISTRILLRELRELYRHRRAVKRSSNSSKTARDPPPHTPAVDAVLEMLSHPWFSRVWVLQEIIMSRVLQVHWRGKVIDWYDVRAYAWVVEATITPSKAVGTGLERMRVFANSYLLQHVPNLQKQGMVSMRTLEEQTSKARRLLWFPYGNRRTRGASLVRLLCTARGFKSEDPRDKVFALLNLTTENLSGDERKASSWTLTAGPVKASHAMRADYTKTCAQVYSEVARHVLHQGQNLRLLCYVEVSTMPGLPSWAPDWTKQTLFPLDKLPFPPHRGQVFADHVRFLGSRARSTKHGSNSRHFQRTRSFSVEGAVLELTGCVLDEVKEVGEVWTSAHDAQCKHILDDWISIFSSSQTPSYTAPSYPYPTTPERTLGRFWEDLLISQRLLVSDPPLPTAAIRPRPDHVMREQWLKSFYCPRKKTNMPRPLRRYLPFYDWLTTALPHASVGRKAASTRTGYMTLVPAETQPGDLICCVDGGGCIPFVLRQVDRGYSLIGACYVHGFLVLGQRWAGSRRERFAVF